MTEDTWSIWLFILFICGMLYGCYALGQYRDRKLLLPIIKDQIEKAWQDGYQDCKEGLR